VQEAASERCDGRGLLLLQQPVHAWGVTLYNAGHHCARIDHKAVWFTLAERLRPGAATRVVA
jgi:hypothetical protein